jgi:hypothetical protein
MLTVLSNSGEWHYRLNSGNMHCESTRYILRKEVARIFENPTCRIRVTINYDNSGGDNSFEATYTAQKRLVIGCRKFSLKNTAIIRKWALTNV